MQLDEFDQSILKIVQENNLRTHGDIGEAVGLSASAVRRRLNILRENGVIEKDVSLLKRELFGVTLIVTVSFHHETLETYAAFEAQMQTLDEVMQCYHTSGSSDYTIIVQVPSLEMYENWAKKELMSNEHIRRYDTIVVWSCKKFKTAVSV